MKRVLVTRSLSRVWLLTLLGLPFLMLGFDYLFGGGISANLGRIIYGADPPAPEWRETVWGWAFLVGGGLATGWGLKELVQPTRLLLADRDGLCLSLSGPLRSATCLGWGEVLDLEEVLLEGDGEPSPAVSLVVQDPARLPANPWGARWTDGQTLTMLADHWSPPASEAVVLMRRLWEASSKPEYG